MPQIIDIPGVGQVEFFRYDRPIPTSRQPRQSCIRRRLARSSRQ